MENKYWAEIIPFHLHENIDLVLEVSNPYPRYGNK